jgi:hypothetical protein
MSLGVPGTHARRILKLLFASACTMALQGCGRVEHVFPSMFTDGNDATVFDVNIGQLAGDITPGEIQNLSSPFIEADYIPTKPLWLINSHWVVHWQGQIIPIPTWVLEPRIETVRLKAISHKTANGFQLRFSAKRKISRYYMLRSIRLLFHEPRPNWPAEPLRLEFSLRTQADLLYSSPPTKLVHQESFRLNAACHVAAGTLTVSNAYPVVHQIGGVRTELLSPEAMSAEKCRR